MEDHNKTACIEDEDDIDEKNYRSKPSYQKLEQSHKDILDRMYAIFEKERQDRLEEITEASLDDKPDSGLMLSKKIHESWPKMSTFLVPNIINFSALFLSREKKSLNVTPRGSMQGKIVWSTGHGKLKATGIELDLVDRDNLFAIMAIYFRENTGGVKTVYVKDILHILGKTDNGKNREILKSSIERLSICLLDYQSNDKKIKYYGKIINLKTGTYIDGCFRLSFDRLMVDVMNNCTFIEVNPYLTLPAPSKSFYCYLSATHSNGAKGYFKLELYKNKTGSPREGKRLRYQCKQDLKLYKG